MESAFAQTNSLPRGLYQLFCPLKPRLFPRNSKKNKAKIAVFFLAALVFLGPLAVLAAPLNYSSDTAVSLTSPAINFTIIASSAADTLVVNATSVVATLSSSTGGNFTLTSASRDLIIASSSAGGTVSQSCVSGIASTTISQSTGSSNYTITPAAAACAIAISNVNSSVSNNSVTITWTTNFQSDSAVSYGTTVSYGSTANGSGGTTSHSVSISSLSYGTTYHYSVSSSAGTTNATSSDATFTTSAQPSSGISASISGGSAAISFGCLDPKSPQYNPSANFNLQSLCFASPTSPGTATPTSTIATSTTSALQAQLNTLMATLQSLIAQARQRGAALPPGMEQPAAPAATVAFLRNLYVGLSGADVNSLQLFLIVQNRGPMAKKLAKAKTGATGYFGPLTKSALIEFQKSAGIKPASGYLGPKTRIYINSLAR